jgi:hypothetical protein
MAYTLSFEKLENYDMDKTGITLPTILRFGDAITSFEAKLDTGSTFCIFERFHGETLGIDVEQGFREYIGTAVGGFVVYGHDVTLSVCGFDFDSTVFFAAEESIKRNVLGRFGWLNKIRLGLIDYDGLLYSSRYDSE